jgi:hypothetical protein
LVEQLVEYLQAVRMPALGVGVTQENLSFSTLGNNKTCADIMTTAKHFILHLENEMFCTEGSRMLRLKVFHQKM